MATEACFRRQSNADNHIPAPLVLLPCCRVQHGVVICMPTGKHWTPSVLLTGANSQNLVLAVGDSGQLHFPHRIILLELVALLLCLWRG